ncbi:hypothetical protein PO124_05770 [Bacillus licheniformis]|nr:hypothetical protein [Bacillus licheniformis]
MSLILTKQTIYQINRNKSASRSLPNGKRSARAVGKVVTSEKERGSRTRSKDLMSPENRYGANCRRRRQIFDRPRNYVFSFMGMAPKDDPQLLVYVAVQQPQLKLRKQALLRCQNFNPVMKTVFTT